MRGVAKVAGIVLLVSAVVAFLFYSLSTSFSNWPFTKSTTFTQGSYRGITLGAQKGRVFEELAIAQQSRRLDWVSIEEPWVRTYDKTFGSRQLTGADQARVTRSDRWHVNLPECDCWAEFDFEGGRLTRVVESRYYGPTE